MSIDTDPDTARQSSRRIGLAQLSGALALVLSIVALGISAYQTRVMQSQARASVWPYLAIGASYFDVGEDAGFRLKVFNHGVGPALMKSVRMAVDGKPVVTWDGYLQATVGHSRDETRQAIFSNFVAVLPPDSNRDTVVEAITLKNPEDAAKAYAAMGRLRLDICYCSVYDDCWTAHLFSRTVDSVPNCPAPGPDDFQD
jgi:hypothetical protein